LFEKSVGCVSEQLLDANHKKTLLVARHIHNFKLRSQLRTTNPEIFQFLSHRLQHLDLSGIDLSQMTSDSRCHLIKNLSKHLQDHLNIIYDRIKYLKECHCASFPNANILIKKQ
jgi:hypothetical protein